MKNTTVFAFVVALLLVPVANSQAPAGPMNRADQPEVKVTYDKFEDATKVSAEIKPAKVSSPDGSSTLFQIPLTAQFRCPGSKVKCPVEGVLLSYAAGAGSLARCDSLDVIFMADGARFPVGQCK